MTLDQIDEQIQFEALADPVQDKRTNSKAEGITVPLLTLKHFRDASSVSEAQKPISSPSA